ncbi:MAG: exodeoxyribonuclease III [Alphaproteobacteria bacterium]|nr:exodeoxyribonuclease III [Alphaproteobacteria bacterium]
MKILTWNINSVRLRLPLLARLAEELSPDVICLQETKVIDDLFPKDGIAALGYKHQHFHGMKSYNGVAILSKKKFDDVNVLHRAGREDCRHIAVKINGIDIHNLYVPAGGDIPDRAQNEKFGHKLDFVDDVNAFFKKSYKKDSPVIAVGDFNIAPFEHDVWSHKQLLDVVSHTPIEVEKLGKWREGLDWADSSREFIPDSEKCYTWWSYRNQDWKKSNRGRRLDHIWVTQPLKKSLKAHHIHQEARDWEKASDHVPLMVTVKT